MFGMDHTRPGVGLDLDGLAVAKARPARDSRDARLLQKPRDTAGETPDDAVLPGHGLGEIETWFFGRDAERIVAGHRARAGLEFLRGVDQRFGGNAADGQ